MLRGNCWCRVEMWFSVLQAWLATKQKRFIGILTLKCQPWKVQIEQMTDACGFLKAKTKNIKQTCLALCVFFSASYFVPLSRPGSEVKVTMQGRLSLGKHCSVKNNFNPRNMWTTAGPSVGQIWSTVMSDSSR